MDFPAPEDHDYNESRPDDYDPIPLTERFTHPVCQSEFIAWKVLLAPDHHDGFYRSALIKRGMESYRGENGTLQEDAIINDAEEFALAAATTSDYSTVRDDPWFHCQRPGRLALVYAAAANGMKYSPAIDTPSFNVSFHYNAAEALLENILGLLPKHPRAMALQQYAAETMFGRTTEDDRGPPPGRTVTDLVEFDDGNWYFEIPLTHASRHMLGRDGQNGPITSIITNNCIYVPYTLAADYIRKRFLKDGPASKELHETYRDMNLDPAFKRFLQNITRINDHIEQIKETNRTPMLHKDKRYPERLRCVLKAVKHAPDKHASLDRRVTASGVLDALNWAKQQVPVDDSTSEASKYADGITSHDQDMIAKFDTPKGVTAFLKQQSDHDDIDFISQDHPQPNLYILSYTDNGARQIDIQTPHDVFELPFVSNLEDYFMENPPEREPLLFLVRILCSLENRFTHEEIAEVFARFPWYDPSTTWYQVGYELTRTAVPIGCENDHTRWGQFCIGQENCDYSIYGSLPIREEVYDRLE